MSAMSAGKSSGQARSDIDTITSLDQDTDVAADTDVRHKAGIAGCTFTFRVDDELRP